LSDRSALEKLVAVTYVEPIAADAAKSVVKQGIQAHGVEIDSERIARVEARLYPIMRKRLESSGISEQIAQIYAREFSSSEICTMFRFYQSSAGKKYLKNMQSLASSMGKVADERLNAFLKDIDDDLVEALNVEGAAITQ
jgi:hypothetical protein